MKQAIINLDDGVDASGSELKRVMIVRELRFKDAIKVASNFEELFSDFSVKDLTGKKFEIFKDLLSGLVDYPEGESIEDLYFSELDLLYQGFKEVNESFLDLMDGMGLLKGIQDQTIKP